MNEPPYDHIECHHRQPFVPRAGCTDCEFNLMDGSGSIWARELRWLSGFRLWAGQQDLRPEMDVEQYLSFRWDPWFITNYEKENAPVPTNPGRARGGRFDGTTMHPDDGTPPPKAKRGRVEREIEDEDKRQKALWDEAYQSVYQFFHQTTVPLPDEAAKGVYDAMAVVTNALSYQEATTTYSREATGVLPVYHPLREEREMAHLEAVEEANERHPLSGDPKRAEHLEEVLGFGYQLAGQILLANNGDHTAGQHDRLVELLLNTLSDPDRYDLDVLHKLRDLALKP